MSTPEVSTRDVAPEDQVHPGDPVTVDRYTAGARINHWITATSLATRSRSLPPSKKAIGP